MGEAERRRQSSPFLGSPAFAFSLFTMLLGLISSRATNNQDRLLPTQSWVLSAPQPGSGRHLGFWVLQKCKPCQGFSPLLQGWDSPAQLCCGGARTVPPGIYTRAHQRQPQHHGSAPQPWLSVKPQNAPDKPSANTDTGAASCTVLLLLTMGGFKVNYCSYPFIPMSCAGLPASACSLQCCFSFL